MILLSLETNTTLLFTVYTFPKGEKPGSNKVTPYVLGPKINKLSACFQKSSNCSSSLNSPFLHLDVKPEQVFKYIVSLQEFDCDKIITSTVVDSITKKISI